jgi:metal-responsive CopG/Arc/MetJ family transcriptional regulator
MGEYDDTTTIEVELPTALLAAVDEAGAAGGYDGRSEAVQAALVAWVDVIDGESEDSGGALGGLSDGLSDVDVDVGVDVGVDE